MKAGKAMSDIEVYVFISAVTCLVLLAAYLMRCFNMLIVYSVSSGSFLHYLLFVILMGDNVVFYDRKR